MLIGHLINFVIDISQYSTILPWVMYIMINVVLAFYYILDNLHKMIRRLVNELKSERNICDDQHIYSRY